jgi:alkyldihydroxyacetonephosphate synthase
MNAEGGQDSRRGVSVPVEPGVREAARRIVGAEWLLEGLPDRLAYARDCWPMGFLLTRDGVLYEQHPDFIAIPGTVDEVRALVALSRDSGTPIIPYGAGSGVCGGTNPMRGGFTLDVKRLAGVRALDEESLTVRAGAGTVGMHLETTLLRRGYTLGHYPSSLICSTLGGYLAGRSAGQNSSRFGKIEDMCLSLEAVMGTGEVIETAAWRPDLTQLLIGSEGTLGVITEASLRIERAPEERVYRGFQFHSLEVALAAVREVVQAGVRPAVVRIYDAFDSLMAKAKGHGRGHRGAASEPEHDAHGLKATLTRLANEALSGPVKSTVDWAAKGLLKRVLGAPMLLNRATARLPLGVLCVMGFEGPAGETADAAEAAFASCRREGVDMGAEPGEHWFHNRFSVSYKLSPMMSTGAFVDTMEVSTTWDNLHNLYQAVRAAIGRSAFVMAHFSHVYPEGSSIYFTFAGFAPEGEPIRALYSRTWSAALEAARRAQAGVAHHHGAGFSKAAYLSADHAGGRALSELLKARFDPARIMNPGKLWDVPPAEGLR